MKSTQEPKNSIKDIHDSELYERIQHAWPGILTLIMNTDGAPIFKSSSDSFWPQQLWINDLPREERFKHIIIAGMFLTNREPKPQFMNLYNLELCKQIKNLTEIGIDIFHHAASRMINLKFTLICCCLDTVARPVCQNRIQFNGY